MSRKLGRLPKPKVLVGLPEAYIIWLFSKADFNWRAIVRELPDINAAHVRRLIDRNRWTRDPNWAFRNSCEQLAYKYAEFYKLGRASDIMPIPADHLAMMGQVLLDDSDLRILRVDGTESEMEEVVDGVPNPKATIDAATKMGAGPQDLLKQVAEMLCSNMLAVPNKMGVTLIPIPDEVCPITADTKLGADGLGNPINVEDYIGGVIMMGRPWDRSYIVPDTKRRADGVKLAASTFGITDKDQLDHIVKKHKLRDDIINSEWKDFERRRKAEDIRKQEEILRTKKDTKDAVDADMVPRILISRPKQLTAAQWKAEKETGAGKTEA